jgi:hypothetical protein
MTLSVNRRQNGPEIDLPVSRVQKAFGPDRPQRTYFYTWHKWSRQLDCNQMSTSEGIHLYSCSPLGNQRRSLLIKQFLMPLSSIHSLLFESRLASPAFQLLQSIDTQRNPLALW